VSYHLIVKRDEPETRWWRRLLRFRTRRRLVYSGPVDSMTVSHDMHGIVNAAFYRSGDPVNLHEFLAG
jgi:hypothetical protein